MMLGYLSRASKLAQCGSLRPALREFFHSHSIFLHIQASTNHEVLDSKSLNFNPQVAAIVSDLRNDSLRRDDHDIQRARATGNTQARLGAIQCRRSTEINTHYPRCDEAIS